MKALTILALAVLIFGSAAYATWVLFLKRQQAVSEERQQPPPPAPPDPTLADFERCQTLESSASMLEVRNSWREFVERYPQSTKIQEAKARLGQINSALFFSAVATPEKTSYTVKQGDVITKVAVHEKSTPELIMRVNNLHGSMLRIGQRLLIPPADFSLQIERRHKVVVLLEGGKFFREYPILAMPVHAAPGSGGGGAKKAGPTPRPPKVLGKVSDKIAWNHGQRVIFSDKGYGDAEHWIVIAPGGHSLYTETGAPAVPGAPAPQKPPGGGYGLAPDAMQELAAMLHKNDPVTID